jgi:acyl-CoA synthetase (AMP-forming)/AMP-acid ligase II
LEPWQSSSDADGAARRAEPTGTRSSPALDPDIAFDLLSSGTTGRPKPIPIRWITIQQAVDDARAVYATPPGNATPADTTTLQRPPAVVIQPLANVAGVTFVVPALAHGQPIVLMEKFELDSWTAIVERYGPARTSLPPAALRMILDANVAPHRLASLKVIGIGGARLDESLRTEFEARYGIVLVPAYGATEFGGVIASWNLDEYRELGPRKRGSVGRARPGVTLRIVNSRHAKPGGNRRDGYPRGPGRPSRPGLDPHHRPRVARCRWVPVPGRTRRRGDQPRRVQDRSGGRCGRAAQASCRRRCGRLRRARSPARRGAGRRDRAAPRCRGAGQP